MRGKYILLIIPALPINERLLSIKIVEKKYHGNIAVNTSIGYGMLPEGNFASFPNTIVNIIIVKSGLTIAQLKPITVCLYLTLRSFHAK